MIAKRVTVKRGNLYVKHTSAASAHVESKYCVMVTIKPRTSSPCRSQRKKLFSSVESLVFKRIISKSWTSWIMPYWAISNRKKSPMNFKFFLNKIKGRRKQAAERKFTLIYTKKNWRFKQIQDQRAILWFHKMLRTEIWCWPF